MLSPQLLCCQEKGRERAGGKIGGLTEEMEKVIEESNQAPP